MVKKLVISIILTGDEIIPYTEKFSLSKVRAINSFVLAGLIEDAGGIFLF